MLSGIKTKFAAWLLDGLQGDGLDAQTRGSGPVPIQQALNPFAFGQDPTLAGFRRLSSKGQGSMDQAMLRDLPLMTHERMQEVAYYLYLTNDLAQWWITTLTAYVVGDGVTLACEDERSLAVAQSFWTDPVNAWPRKLPAKVRELALYGEQCWPLFAAPGTGRVRLGYLDPTLIQEVVLDPDNAEQAIGVVTKKWSGYAEMPERRYRVRLPIAEAELTRPAQRLREHFGDGEVSYYAINKVSNGSRGWSDLLAKADWLDGYEQFMFQRLERADLANRVVWDMTLTGMTQAQIEEFQKSFALPKPGGVHVHNEKVTLEAKAPDLKASDAAEDARLFRNHCLSPMPEHWYGGGGDVNRAAATEMDEPTYKRFKLRQQEVKAIVEEQLACAVREAKLAGMLEQSASEDIKALFPEMVKADLGQLATAAQSVSAAISQQRAEGTITKAEARQIFAVAVKPIGVELPERTDAELAALAADEDVAAETVDYRETSGTGETRGTGGTSQRDPSRVSRAG
jgi:hypothetical protein